MKCCIFLGLLTVLILSTPGKCNFVPMLVVFGDSFVDSGNNNHLNTTARANHYPYGINFDGRLATGRWSDGRIITDYLASYMSAEFPPCYLDDINITQGANFGSAGSGIMNDTHIGGQVLTFTDQIDGFQQWRSELDTLIGSRLAYYLTTKSVFYINIGNNDVNDYVQNNNATLTMEFRSVLLDQMHQKLHTLYHLGARKVVIVSMYALGCAPLYQTQGDCGPLGLQSAEFYNQGMLDLISDLQTSHRSLRIVFANAYEVMREVYQNPQAYGLSNVTSPCCPTNSTSSWCYRGDAFCSDPSSYMFWDIAHPTNAFNKIAATLFWNGSQTYASPINIRTLVNDF